MASTKELRKTLPRRAPNHERHLQDDMSQKTAIYSLVNLNAAQLQELEDTNNEGEEDDTGRIGVARCKSDKAAGWFICFKLAEMLWSELKYAEYEEWGGSNPYEKHGTAIAEGEYRSSMHQ